jgi:cold shock CspA family protein
MTKGKINWYDPLKGYGFILINDGLIGETYFFHKHDCLYENIQIGDRVTTSVVKSERKPGSLCCVNVELIK